ncbi:MAG: hypothetical protein WB988_18560, partial [Candidatus Nitrosopolaris sp.]
MSSPVISLRLFLSFNSISRLQLYRMGCVAKTTDKKLEIDTSNYLISFFKISDYFLVYEIFKNAVIPLTFLYW